MWPADGQKAYLTIAHLDEPAPIKGSYSIDPTVFQDTDGKAYLYFGGIWGGQLQRWSGNKYDAEGALKKPDELAYHPRVARLSADMKEFTEPVKELQLVDETGKPFHEKDNDKRFFEAAWLHKYNGKYYFSYSTSDTHNICYAMDNSPTWFYHHKKCPDTKSVPGHFLWWQIAFLQAYFPAPATGMAG